MDLRFLTALWLTLHLPSATPCPSRSRAPFPCNQLTATLCIGPCKIHRSIQHLIYHACSTQSELCLCFRWGFPGRSLRLFVGRSEINGVIEHTAVVLEVIYLRDVAYPFPLLLDHMSQEVLSA
ncbi:hypothetical protein BV20DRAFT_398153 [Pilatotrama ljubarskyi]|nr:hypothetical protein BV20DRAFT_398153 [Pilatotrama ljubarskyi]